MHCSNFTTPRRLADAHFKHQNGRNDRYRYSVQKTSQQLTKFDTARTSSSRSSLFNSLHYANFTAPRHLADAPFMHKNGRNDRYRYSVQKTSQHLTKFDTARTSSSRSSLFNSLHYPNFTAPRRLADAPFMHKNGRNDRYRYSVQKIVLNT